MTGAPTPIKTAVMALPLLLAHTHALALGLDDPERGEAFRAKVQRFYDSMPNVIAADCPAGQTWSLPVPGGIARCTAAGNTTAPPGNPGSPGGGGGGGDGGDGNAPPSGPSDTDGAPSDDGTGGSGEGGSGGDGAPGGGGGSTDSGPCSPGTDCADTGDGDSGGDSGGGDAGDGGGDSA